MRISVIIPAYNCAATIRATLDSVFCQSQPAHEILVMDDGSTDETAQILKEYEPKIKIFWQPNGGVSSVRNALIARAEGDLIAQLDSDDLWHPRYLATQQKLIEQYPQAVAVFVGHDNFAGLGAIEWEQVSIGDAQVDVLQPVNFLQRIRKAPGPFLMSFCCIPKLVLSGIGPEPFKLEVAEDVYFSYLLACRGPVILASSPLLGAYRIREGSLASNRLRCVGGEVEAFELLEETYRNGVDSSLVKEFKMAFVSRRRELAKILFGAGKYSEARSHLWRTLGQCSDPTSLLKSSAMLFLSFLPKLLQPEWLPVDRQWQDTTAA